VKRFVLVLLCVAPAARAQVRVTAAPIGARVQSVLIVQGQREESSGMWLGGRFTLRAGPLLLEGIHRRAIKDGQ
jgi:hypothetical protein